MTEGERTGRLRPGLTIVDSSSGNTAVGLALVGRAKGYAVELFMPESVSEERKKLCRAYGASVTFTPAFDGSDGALEAVRRRVAEEPGRYWYADQYRSPANPLAHYRTTGPEIWEQTDGRVTHFVGGLGTTGTIVGTGRYLHERGPHVRVIAVEPDEPLHGLEGLKHLPSAIVPEVYDPGVEDRKVRVATEDGYRLVPRGAGERRAARRPLGRRRALGRARDRARRGRARGDRGAAARRRRAVPGEDPARARGGDAGARAPRLPVRGLRRPRRPTRARSRR